MYKYETHLHTIPVSACARADVREVLECYKEMEYDGVFITNHFLDGNINIDRTLPYEDKIEFYFSDYEEALRLSEEIGIKVLLGVEMSYKGTDFLVYGLDKRWFLSNPQIMDMKQREKLTYLMENGGYIVQAHPFRQASYIDHIRLFPANVNAIEVINANRTELENGMAKIYAESYKLHQVAGSDNHVGKAQLAFAGVMTEQPIENVQDYIRMVENNEIELFMYQR